MIGWHGMKTNPGKCCMLASKNGSFDASVGENKISNTKPKKLLEVTFDNRFSYLRRNRLRTKQLFSQYQTFKMKHTYLQKLPVLIVSPKILLCMFQQSHMGNYFYTKYFLIYLFHNGISQNANTNWNNSDLIKVL